MKRASYREAISWIALNDDTEWTAEDEKIPSVSAVLVADLFDVEVDRVTRDIIRKLKKLERDQ